MNIIQFFYFKTKKNYYFFIYFFIYLFTVASSPNDNRLAKDNTAVDRIDITDEKASNSSTDTSQATRNGQIPSKHPVPRVLLFVMNVCKCIFYCDMFSFIYL